VRHVVRGSHEAASVHEATGFADLTGFAGAARLQAAYAAQLRREGWVVKMRRQRVAKLELTRPSAMLCHVIASQAGHGLMLTVSDGTAMMNRLFWREGEQKVPSGAVSGPCRYA